jgi:hypothetical protein
VIELRQHAWERPFFVIGGTIFAALLFPQEKPKEITHEVTVTKPSISAARQAPRVSNTRLRRSRVAAAKANRPQSRSDERN